MEKALVVTRGNYLSRRSSALAKLRKEVGKKTRRSNRKRRSTSKQKWYKPRVHSGWKKDMPKAQRRALELRAHNQDFLKAARAKQSLANITQDSATRRAALEDARYFLALYHKEKDK